MMHKLLNNSHVSSSIALFESWVEHQRVAMDIPAISIGVIWDQELIWAKGFGFSDLSREIEASPKTNFRIASITKLFTASAIMQLQEQQKLNLEDSVSRHLPWFKLKGKDGESSRIVIRHLLTHTAGLPREAAFPYWTNFEFPSLDLLKDSILNQEMIYPPHTRLKYSNLGYSLLGEIVTQASGYSYEDYVTRFILKPLEMNYTHIPLSSDSLAKGYSRRVPYGDRVERPFSECKALNAAAGFASNVLDLAKFVAAQFTDVVLSKASLEEMHRVQRVTPDWEKGIGVGFNFYREGNRILLGHAGWIAGYRSQLAIDLKEKVGVVAVTNCDEGAPWIFVRKAFQLVVSKILELFQLQKQLFDFDPAWKSYLGKYRSSWSDSEVLVLDGELKLYTPEGIRPTERIATLRLREEHTFVLESEDVGAPIGELVIFEFNGNGKVARMKVGQNYSEKM